MAAKFVFSAFGILAIAALCLFLYAPLSASGNQDTAAPLLGIAEFIVFAFIAFMFIKLFLGRH